jgi:protoheme IX farnesyltransferase
MAATPLITQCKAIAALIRVRLSLTVALSAFAGFVVINHGISLGAGAAFAGVALLAAAGSALNQFQERAEDAMMERTKDRPLPMGVKSPRQVLVIAALFALAGILLLISLKPAAAILGVFALVWYNAVYTPLKKRTVFALPVGALTGAIAPVIGCVAATGGIDRRAAGIALFMFFWQIGHFLLLLLRFGKEYEKAGVRTILSLITAARLRTITSIWLLGTAACATMFPLFGLITGVTSAAALLLINASFVACFFAGFVLKKESDGFRLVFRCTYLLQGAVLLLLVGEGLLSRTGL